LSQGYRIVIVRTVGFRTLVPDRRLATSVNIDLVRIVP
jgi:hypothetical protein